MKIINLTAVFIFLALNADVLENHVAAQNVEKRVSEIRKLYNQVSKDAEPDASKLRSNELIVGKLHGPARRAVGQNSGVYTFFYYDDDIGTMEDIYKRRIRLVKIVVSLTIGSGCDSREYLLNAKGDIVFYFSKSGDCSSPEEKRYYFDDNGVIVRAQFKEDVQDKPDQAFQRGAGGIFNELSTLKKLFEHMPKE